MTLKEFKKLRLQKFKNKRGYWEKGGGAYSELKFALVLLVITCAAVGYVIYQEIITRGAL